MTRCSAREKISCQVEKSKVEESAHGGSVQTSYICAGGNLKQFQKQRSAQEHWTLGELRMNELMSMMSMYTWLGLADASGERYCTSQHDRIEARTS